MTATGTSPDLLALAAFELARGRADRALAALERVTGSDLETSRFWFLRAHALCELRSWSEAAAAAHHGLARDPNNADLLEVLARAELGRGERKKALAAIETAVALHPGDATLHARRALVLAAGARKRFRRLSLRKARAAIDEALRLDSRSEGALRVRAHLAVLSRDRRATEYGEELLALDPEDERAHILAGAALARRGNVARSGEHFLEAGRLDPSNPDAVWLARRSRVLQGWFAAPLLFADRLTRGHFRAAWIVVVLLAFGTRNPVIVLAVVVFAIYTWTVRLYLRLRVGKAPR